MEYLKIAQDLEQYGVNYFQIKVIKCFALNTNLTIKFHNIFCYFKHDKLSSFNDK